MRNLIILFCLSSLLSCSSNTSTNPLRTSEGYNPGLIIPSHENELGHTIDHREAYALNYSRWNVPYDKIIMTWGELYHYQP